MGPNELRSKLEDGLHPENLRAMLEIAKALTGGVEAPLPFYVVASVLGDLGAKWSDRPVTSSQAAIADKELVPALRQVVFSVQREAPIEELFESLNRLISSYIELDERGALG